MMLTVLYELTSNLFEQFRTFTPLALSFAEKVLIFMLKVFVFTIFQFLF